MSQKMPIESLALEWLRETTASRDGARGGDEQPWAMEGGLGGWTSLYLLWTNFKSACLARVAELLNINP